MRVEEQHKVIPGKLYRCEGVNLITPPVVVKIKNITDKGPGRQTLLPKTSVVMAIRTMTIEEMGEYHAHYSIILHEENLYRIHNSWLKEMYIDNDEE